VSALALLLVAATLVACGGEQPVNNNPDSGAKPANTQGTTSNPTPAGGQDTSSGTTSGATPNANVGRGGAQAEHIEVQHILIGFKDAIGFQGNPPPAAANRTQDQARTLAYDLYNQAKNGADFDALVAANTDDSPPGIYGMSNKGVQPAEGEYPREGMVPAFGNVGFNLGVGDIGVADYDPATSPYGYHIIKRIK
jgi:hypothetical protein